MSEAEWVGVEKPTEVSHKQIYDRLAKVEEKVDSIDNKTAQVVVAFEAAQNAFTVLDWIGKLAKPILWLVAVGAAITALYERWAK